MKHKLLFGFATAAMAAVMCVGFAACGGGPDAKSVKGEKITEEQWASYTDVFEKEDAKYTIETSVKSESEKASGTTTLTYSVNGSKAYYKLEASGKSDGKDVDKLIEVYIEAKDNSYVVYTKGEDGKWTSEEERTSPYDYTDTLGPLTSMMSVLVSYSAFEYSEEESGYVLKNLPEGATSPVIKFDKDGRLAAIYYEGKQDAGGTEMTLELNLVVEYDAKNIDLPKVD